MAKNLASSCLFSVVDFTGYSVGKYMMMMMMMMK